jgi:hypothetical protein
MYGSEPSRDCSHALGYPTGLGRSSPQMSMLVRIPTRRESARVAQGLEATAFSAKFGALVPRRLCP